MKNHNILKYPLEKRWMSLPPLLPNFYNVYELTDFFVEEGSHPYLIVNSYAPLVFSVGRQFLPNILIMYLSQKTFDRLFSIPTFLNIPKFSRLISARFPENYTRDKMVVNSSKKYIPTLMIHYNYLIFMPGSEVAPTVHTHQSCFLEIHLIVRQLWFFKVYNIDKR